MKMFKKKSLKLNNAGMTLIELLVAIAIMAVALAPLLYAFVNVARYNARARELQQTTTMAHTIIENCKAYSMEEFNTKISSTNNFFPGVLSSQIVGDVAEDSYYHYYMNNVEVEGETYDIVLKLTPRGINGDSTTEYNIIETKNINKYMDAVFTPEGTVFQTTINGVNYGDVSAANLEQLAYVSALQAISERMEEATEDDMGDDGGVVLTESQIEDSFKDDYAGNKNFETFSCSRKTIIWLADMDSWEGVNVQISYTFDTTDGKYYYEHTFPDGSTHEYNCLASTTVSVEQYIYTNHLTRAERYDGNHPKLENVYFFYYPGYNDVFDEDESDEEDGAAGSIFPILKDEFLISNTIADGTGTRDDINVYLIKQKNPTYDDTKLSILESEYTPYVDSYYSHGVTEATNVFHNFEVNLGDGGATLYNKSTWFKYDLNVMPGLLDLEDDPERTSYLIKDDKTLMFDIELNFYDANAFTVASPVLDADEEPIFSMDGTTLNW